MFAKKTCPEVSVKDLNSLILIAHLFLAYIKVKTLNLQV